MKKKLRKPSMKKMGIMLSAYVGEGAGYAIICGYNF